MKLGTEQNEGKKMEMIQLGAGRSYLGAYGVGGEGVPRRKFTAKPSKAQAAFGTGGQDTAQGREIGGVSESRKIV